MQNQPAKRNSPQADGDAKAEPNLLKMLDPKTHHQLLNEFHGIRTGLYLLDAAYHANDDGMFERTIHQLGAAIDRLTQGELVPDNQSVESKSDQV